MSDNSREVLLDLMKFAEYCRMVLCVLFASRSVSPGQNPVPAPSLNQGLSKDLFIVPFPDAPTLEGKFAAGPSGIKFQSSKGEDYDVYQPNSGNAPKLNTAALMGSVELEVGEFGWVKTAEVKPLLVERLKSRASDLCDPVLKLAVSEELQELEKHLQAPLKNKESGDKKTAASIDATQESIRKRYLESDPVTQDIDLDCLSALYVSLDRQRRISADKANYGYDGEYAPPTYPCVFDCCRSVAAVQQSGKTVGACFLIGENLVLTARHCLRNESKIKVPQASLSFVFYEPTKYSPPKKAPNPKIYHLQKVILEGKNESEDYALLKIGKRIRGVVKGPSDESIASLPIDLTSESMGKYRSVYAIGFPESGPIIVADGARVVVPYILSSDEYTDLKLRFRAEVLKAKESAEKDNQGTGAALELNLMERFRKSFTPRGDGSTDYRFTSAMLNQRAPLPAFALDSNTHSGNSGGPVLARKDSMVVGLFCRGWQTDTTLLEAGLQKHEEAIPICYILKSWDEYMKNLPEGHEMKSFTPASFGVAVPQ